MTRPLVLCVGESMVMFTPESGSGAALPTYSSHVGGAESNVAASLAHLGHDVEWYGKLGADPFSAQVLGVLREHGVKTPAVEIDPVRATGIYFKNRIGGQTEIYYYRAGSAAAAMSVDDVQSMALASRELCHVSGITAALSPSADALLTRIVIDRDEARPIVSFDVNYRKNLWDVATAGPRLLTLARNADIVIVGRDEAELLWQTETADDIRSLIPNAPILIVKDAEVGAHLFDASGSVFVPALEVEVAEPVGAGDAFAAGYLAGWLQGWPSFRSLRLGHLLAAYTLQSHGDLPVLPARDVLLEMTQVDDNAWRGSIREALDGLTGGAAAGIAV